MNELTNGRLIWVAGAIQAGIVLVNGASPGRQRVRENIGSAPGFIRQVFYVHWVYIVLTVGFFSALGFGFARDLAGATDRRRFLSGFRRLRVGLQCFRRDNGWLDAVYLASLITWSFIFARAAIVPVA